MVRHKATALVLSIAVGAALSACGGGGGESTGSGSGGGTLTYWATNMAPTLADDAKVLQPELAKFEKQTGVKVDLEVIPWDSLYNRILTAVSSGEGPDVLNIGNTWSASLQATGAFAKFDDKTFATIGGKDRFLKTSLASTGAEGETPTSVPLYGQSYGLFYNKKLFAEAGITTPPATWDDFVAAAKKLTKDKNGDGKPDQYGFAMTGAAVPNDSHAAFIFGRQQGAQLFAEDGKPQFASDAEVAAVKRFVDLMGTHKVTLPGSAEYTSDPQAANDLATGKVAMVMQQSGSRSAFAQLGFKDYGVAEVPVPSPLPDGGENVQTMVAGINISVFDNSDKKDAAVDLVKFLTSTEEQVVINKKYGTLPVVQDAYKDPSFTDPVSKTFGTILREHAQPMPQIPQEGQMETLVGGALKNLLAKAATGGEVSEAAIRAELQKANEQMAAAS